jgi:type I site-specific restriction-modification system R (restriction) subunit
VFAGAVSAIDTTAAGDPWLTEKQLHDVHDHILRQPSRTLLEANEAVQKLLFKAQVDCNEATGEQDPVVRLIDFAEPENNQFHAVNQFRIDTPGCVKQFISGMLNKQNLLHILRTCSVFMDTDSGSRIKVVCRYQQFRAAGRICDRLRRGSTQAAKSGVVWHTQGSGKSLTMVFTARMMRASRDLSDYKIVLVNDRIDLEEQLSKTATLIGGRVNMIENTSALRRQLSPDSSDINMVMVHKFQQRETALSLKVAEALGTYQAMPSGKSFGVVNASERILLMIDEAHRTQGSDLGDNIFEAFPNAVRVAFTGTPLITERHGEKKTYKRFGQYIDTYRLMDAVNDGATLQILYEGKTADAALNDKHGFETAFEDLFRDRSDEELLAIKKKYGATGDILEAEARIKAIAADMVDHYISQILPNGFKAQVVCHSKLAAVRYQAAIAGRTTGKDGMSREATTFYAHIANEAFAGGKVPDDAKARMKLLMEAIVDTLQESIGSIDYWANADKQKRTRSDIKTALMLTGIEELKQNRERVAVEIMKLAKSRHEELLKGSKA